MMEHIRQAKILMVNFPKTPQVYLSKNYASLYFVILLYIDEVHEEGKINASQLKSPFRRNGQFDPNLAQNCDTLFLMICSTVRIFFYTQQHNEAGQLDSSINQFSQNISFSGKRAIRAQFCPSVAQNYSTLYLMICLKIFLKHFCMMRHSRQTIVTLVSFLRNPILVQLGNLSPFSAKIMQPYITSNCLMICSLGFLKCCHMMGFNIQTEVMLVSLSKNSLPGKGN